ncbi:MAG TPA: helix-hairpin-helix domain-containing protein [Terriglobia bacterium]|nr:helix-hairpin-helix domain-containing protein [Terriglobia bacterium]
MQESAPTPIENMPGLTPALVQKLATSGITTVEQLADLAPEDLENIPGIGNKTVEKIKDVLSEYYAQLPSYQDDLVRQAAEHMFSKSVDEPAEEASETGIGETDAPKE